MSFGPTPVLVDNGRVRIWQEQVATGTNGEWEIFHMQTTNGGPLANNLNANWNITIDYTLRVPASFAALVVLSPSSLACSLNVCICCLM